MLIPARVISTPPAPRPSMNGRPVGPNAPTSLLASRLFDRDEAVPARAPLTAAAAGVGVRAAMREERSRLADPALPMPPPVVVGRREMPAREGVRESSLSAIPACALAELCLSASER